VPGIEQVSSAVHYADCVEGCLFCRACSCVHRQ
jgi:hypothetical protein